MANPDWLALPEHLLDHILESAVGRGRERDAGAVMVVAAVCRQFARRVLAARRSDVRMVLRRNAVSAKSLWPGLAALLRWAPVETLVVAAQGWAPSSHPQALPSASPPSAVDMLLGLHPQPMMPWTPTFSTVKHIIIHQAIDLPCLVPPFIAAACPHLEQLQLHECQFTKRSHATSRPSPPCPTITTVVVMLPPPPYAGLALPATNHDAPSLALALPNVRGMALAVGRPPSVALAPAVSPVVPPMMEAWAGQLTSLHLDYWIGDADLRALVRMPALQTLWVRRLGIAATWGHVHLGGERVWPQLREFRVLGDRLRLPDVARLPLMHPSTAPHLCRLGWGLADGPLHLERVFGSDLQAVRNVADMLASRGLRIETPSLDIQLDMHIDVDEAPDAMHDEQATELFRALVRCLPPTQTVDWTRHETHPLLVAAMAEHLAPHVRHAQVAQRYYPDEGSLGNTRLDDATLALLARCPQLRSVGVSPPPLNMWGPSSYSSTHEMAYDVVRIAAACLGTRGPEGSASGDRGCCMDVLVRVGYVCAGGDERYADGVIQDVPAYLRAYLPAYLPPPVKLVRVMRARQARQDEGVWLGCRLCLGTERV